MDDEYVLKPVGMVLSPFKHKEDVPIKGYQDTLGKIKVFKEYEEGLKDVEGFSHLVILWIFHESEGYSLLVKPLAHEVGPKGVFSTSHPDRPNHIGITIVELIEIAGNVLNVKGIDMADGSPVVDIKPYSRKYCREDIKTGWIENG